MHTTLVKTVDGDVIQHNDGDTELILKMLKLFLRCLGDIKHLLCSVGKWGGNVLPPPPKKKKKKKFVDLNFTSVKSELMNAYQLKLAKPKIMIMLVWLVGF